MLADFPSDFRYVLGLQEAVVVGMADGFAQASGRTTVANLHTAPGVGNAMGAIFNAQANHSPLLITAGQQARAQITLQANLTNRDAIRMPHPLVKWSYEPPRAEDVPLALAHGAHLASLPPRGPVFVSLPMDDWYAEVDEADARDAIEPQRRAAAPSPTPRRCERSPSASTPPPTRSSSPAPTSTPPAAGTPPSRSPSASACRSGRRPATGGGRLGFPEGHPNFRGVLPPAIGPVGQTLEGHDLILVAGSSVFPYYPYIPGPLLPEGAKLVAITSDPDEAARAPMGDALVADVELTLAALLEAVPESTPPGAGAEPAPAGNPGHRPAQPLDRPHGAGRGPARGRDRRPRVALEHPRPAQPAAPLAARQLLLQRRRRPRLRPRRLDRRAAGPARPPGRLRDRRGLGPVRGQRLLERGRLRRPVTFLVLRNAEYAILKWFAEVEQVSGAPGLDLPASTSPRSPRATASTHSAPASAKRCARRWRARSRPRSPELVEVPVAPGMSLF